MVTLYRHPDNNHILRYNYFRKYFSIEQHYFLEIISSARYEPKLISIQLSTSKTSLIFQPYLRADQIRTRILAINEAILNLIIFQIRPDMWHQIQWRI